MDCLIISVNSLDARNFFLLLPLVTAEMTWQCFLGKKTRYARWISGTRHDCASWWAVGVTARTCCVCCHCFLDWVLASLVACVHNYVYKYSVWSNVVLTSHSKFNEECTHKSCIKAASPIFISIAMWPLCRQPSNCTAQLGRPRVRIPPCAKGIFQHRAIPVT